jgi:hypothetical protein
MHAAQLRGHQAQSGWPRVRNAGLEEEDRREQDRNYCHALAKAILRGEARS